MSKLLVFCFLALLGSACTYDNGDRPEFYDDPSYCTTETKSDIDADAELEVDAGEGAGVFVEYAAGGHWHVRVSCDTERRRREGERNPPPCTWDLLLTPETGRSLSKFDTRDLGGEDRLSEYDDDVAEGTFQLITTTASEVDGVRFDSTPGAAISIDAYIDDTCQPSLFYWVDQGAVHKGSNGNPLDLYPASK